MTSKVDKVGSERCLAGGKLPSLPAADAPDTMVILRPTRKLVASLPPSADVPSGSDTALGDWYVNRIVVARRPLLLLVSSRSLLPILAPAREVRQLPVRLPGLVAARLGRLGVAQELIDAEIQAMTPVRIAETEDRSVVGILVDFAKNVPYFFLDFHPWDDFCARVCRVAAGSNAVPCRPALRRRDLSRQEDAGAAGALVHGPQPVAEQRPTQTW